MSEEPATYDGEVLTTAERAFNEMAGDRIIAYRRVYVDVTGSVTAALLLSQLVYWQQVTNKMPGRAGTFFYKTQRELTDETGLTRSEQESARKQLRKCQHEGQPLVEETRRGVPAKLHYRVNLSVLMNLVANVAANKIAGIPQTGLQESRKLESRNPANWIAGITQTITETTAEIPIAYDKTCPADAGGAPAENDRHPAPMPGESEQTTPPPPTYAVEPVSPTFPGETKRARPAAVPKPTQRAGEKRAVIEEREMCDAAAAAMGVKPVRWNAKQRGAARALLDSGADAAEVRALVAWMRQHRYWGAQAFGIEALPGRLLEFRNQPKPKEHDPYAWNVRL